MPAQQRCGEPHQDPRAFPEPSQVDSGAQALRHHRIRASGRLGIARGAVQRVFPPGKWSAEEDPAYRNADWRPAAILPPPKAWGGGVTDVAAIRPKAGRSATAIAHWAAVLPGLEPGKYTLCCRSIDNNGIAQPMPRPLPQDRSERDPALPACS